jgi:hypothetical protein
MLCILNFRSKFLFNIKMEFYGLSNDIINIILSNLQNPHLRTKNLDLTNKNLLQNYLHSTHNRISLKKYIKIDINDEFVCTLDYYDILTKQYIQNFKQKKKLKYPLTISHNAYYLDNLKIAFITFTNNIDIYTYCKETLDTTLYTKINLLNIEKLYVLKNRKVLLSNFSGYLILLESESFKQICMSNIASSISKLVEVDKGKFVTASMNKLFMLWSSDNLHIIKNFVYETVFNIYNNVRNLHCMVGIKDGGIYLECERFNNNSTIVITCGVWKIDNNQFKLLLTEDNAFSISFFETDNYLILISKVRRNPKDIPSIIRLYNPKDYNYIKSINFEMTSQSKIYSIENNYLLVLDSISIKIYEADNFQLIDDVEVVTNKLSFDPNRKEIVGVGNTTYVFRLSK